MNKTLIIIGAVILAGFVFGFVYWSANVKPKRADVGFPPAEDLCAKFSKVEGEISCQEAKDLALAKYPGQATNIEKTSLSVAVAKPPIEKTTQKDVWLVGISLKEPVVLPAPPGGKEIQKFEIKVAVDRRGKDVLLYQAK